MLPEIVEPAIVERSVETHMDDVQIREE